MNNPISCTCSLPSENMPAASCCRCCIVLHVSVPPRLRATAPWEFPTSWVALQTARARLGPNPGEVFLVGKLVLQLWELWPIMITPVHHIARKSGRQGRVGQGVDSTIEELNPANAETSETKCTNSANHPAFLSTETARSLPCLIPLAGDV